MNSTHRLKDFRLSVLTVFDHEELPDTLMFWRKIRFCTFHNILKQEILTKQIYTLAMNHGMEFRV